MGRPEEDFVPRDPLTPDERDPETPTADAFEQASVVRPDDGDEEIEVHRGLEVADWDAIEQAQVVGPDDEDDYR